MRGFATRNQTCPKTTKNHTKKKTFRHPDADEEKREQHERVIEALKEEGRPLVYIDESGFELDTSRDDDYCEKSQRCVVDVKNWQPKGRINAIGALLLIIFTDGNTVFWKH